jgi:hypothetical protein
VYSVGAVQWNPDPFASMLLVDLCGVWRVALVAWNHAVACSKAYK